MADPADRFQELLRQVSEELKARGITLPGVITGQWGTFGRYIRGGWRSAAGWVCVLSLFVNGVVLPVARLFGFQGEPLAWEGMAALVAALGALTHYRSKDLQAGATT